MLAFYLSLVFDLVRKNAGNTVALVGRAHCCYSFSQDINININISGYQDIKSIFSDYHQNVVPITLIIIGIMYPPICDQ